MHILIVEDELATAEALSELLQTMGHSVIVKYRAQEALKTLKAHNFDLIISDYKMPKMSGVEFRESMLTQDLSQAPFIFFTANPYDLRDNIEPYKYTDLITKGTHSVQDILKVINKME